MRNQLVAGWVLVLAWTLGGNGAVAGDAWVLHSTAGLAEATTPEATGTASLELARNETESVQVVVLPAVTEKLTVRSSLDIPGLAMTCREIADVQGYDDALIARSTFSGRKGEPLKLWVSYATTAECEPGAYRDTFVLEGGAEKFEVTVDLRVHPVILPRTPSIPAVFGIQDQMFTTAYRLPPGSRRSAMMARWAELLLDYRISPYFFSWVGGSMQHEAYASPWPLSDKRTMALLSDERFRRIAMPFYSLTEPQLSASVELLRRHGLVDKVFYYLWDEPTRTEEYAKIRAAADRIHAVAPEADVLTTFYCGPENEGAKGDVYSVFPLWRGATQIYSMSTWALGGREENAARCRAALQGDEEWWTYVCMAPGDPHPNVHLKMTGMQHRAVMWRAWKEGGTGFLYWAVNIFEPPQQRGERLRFREDVPPGDGLLVYPGELFGASGPAASVRLERWRDGFEDYELLVQIEQEYGREAALKLLAEVYQNPDRFTQSAEAVERFRQQALKAL